MTGRQRLISTLVWIAIFETGYWAYWASSSESFNQVVVAGILVVAIQASRIYEEHAKKSAPLVLARGGHPRRLINARSQGSGGTRRRGSRPTRGRAT